MYIYFPSNDNNHFAILKLFCYLFDLAYENITKQEKKQKNTISDNDVKEVINNKVQNRQ